MKDLLSLRICPSCMALDLKPASPPESGVGGWRCAACRYHSVYLPTIGELLSGTPETTEGWDDVNVGAWLRRCTAVILLHVEEIAPEAGRTLGIALLTQDPKLAGSLLEEINALRALLETKETAVG